MATKNPAKTTKAKAKPKAKPKATPDSTKPTATAASGSRTPTQPRPQPTEPQPTEPGAAKPDPRNVSRCVEFAHEANDDLQRKRHGKVNELAKCNECEPDETSCAVITSPFDAALLNTGRDQSGQPIPSGSGTDLCWEAGLGDGTGPNSVTSWIPAFVFRDSAWVASPFANANWISFFHDSHHSGRVDVYFRIRFSLNSSVDVSQFFLDMSFYADNSVWDIYVNGNPQSAAQPTLLPQSPNSPYQHRGFDRGRAVDIHLQDDWRPCANELIVHVKSNRPKIGFLAQNTTRCYEADLPSLAPTVAVSWGDSECDCFETDDLEVAYVTVCNPYSNVVFNNFTVGRIRIVNDDGSPVATLPDGTPSVEVIAPGPHCFGDIQSCNDEQGGNCVSREFAIRTRGAKDGTYTLLLDSMCYSVSLNYASDECFAINLCKD